MNWTSEMGQDAWVAACLGEQRDGYFVDVGAFDGVKHSNTFVLENDFGWRGLCVEPNPTAYAQLCRHRRAVCVPAALDGPQFNEQAHLLNRALVDAHGLSCLADLAHQEDNADQRRAVDKGTIIVPAYRPYFLFDYMDVPRHIDYLSIDTEGADERVLREIFRCDRTIALITIEHAHVIHRKRNIDHCLLSRGYCVVLDNPTHDGYYWHPDFIASDRDPDKIFEQVQSYYAKA